MYFIIYLGKLAQEQPCGVLENHSLFTGVLIKEESAKSFQARKSQCRLSVRCDHSVSEALETVL